MAEENIHKEGDSYVTRVMKKIPFFHVQSVKMWVSLLGALYVGWQTYDGCERKRIDKAEKIELIPYLKADIDALKSLRFTDSIRESGQIDDLYDTAYDHRTDLNFLYQRSRITRPIFRGK